MTSSCEAPQSASDPKLKLLFLLSDARRVVTPTDAVVAGSGASIGDTCFVDTFRASRSGFSVNKRTRVRSDAMSTLPFTPKPARSARACFSASGALRPEGPVLFLPKEFIGVALERSVNAATRTPLRASKRVYLKFSRKTGVVVAWCLSFSNPAPPPHSVASTNEPGCRQSISTASKSAVNVFEDAFWLPNPRLTDEWSTRNTH
mmetsp:Transcript_13424/g.44412  ORF Transcript_13424/g.44412 Transcript_13424/m.44412 type:complete len:204 (+) Transcript_13424:269-880(+)